MALSVAHHAWPWAVFFPSILGGSPSCGPPAPPLDRPVSAEGRGPCLSARRLCSWWMFVESAGQDRVRDVIFFLEKVACS